jgi:hypothetical protein
MTEKISLSLSGEVKHFWGREVYTSCFTMKERKWYGMVQAGKLENTKSVGR